MDLTDANYQDLLLESDAADKQIPISTKRLPKTITLKKEIKFLGKHGNIKSTTGVIKVTQTPKIYPDTYNPDNAFGGRRKKRKTTRRRRHKRTKRLGKRL
jgi:hypothetical protein